MGDNVDFRIFKSFLHNKEYVRAQARYSVLRLGRALTYATYASLAFVALTVVAVVIKFGGIYQLFHAETWTREVMHLIGVMYFTSLCAFTLLFLGIMSSSDSPFWQYYGQEIRKLLLDSERGEE